MNQLARFLFRELTADFFRVLSSPQAPIYVDVLDAIERESAQRNHGIDREEVLAIVEQVVSSYGHLLVDAPDEVPITGGKARSLLEVLFTSGWLHEEQHSDWQRLVYFDSNGAVLIQTLRKIAVPDSVVFSDKIVNVCATLANRESLAYDPWPQIESCIANLQVGLSELRGMQRSIERHTKQQLAASTIKENLSVLFDQFSESIGRTCYSQLVHARLPSRLALARRDLDYLEADPDVMAKMQVEVLRRGHFDTPEAATSHVRLRLDELRDLLYQVEPAADEIDRRTAEFTRRSQARFRYLQETTSENRTKIQTFFATISRAFAGRRINDIDLDELTRPDLLLHEIRLPAGVDSLYSPRLHHSTTDIEPLDEIDTKERDRTLAQLAANIRDSLTVNRANRFVALLPGRKGTQFSSAELLRDHVHNDEDLAHLIACLLNAETAEAKYEIHVPRRDQEADQGEFDTKLRYRVERFTVVKK